MARWRRLGHACSFVAQEGLLNGKSELLQTVRFHHGAREESAANAKVIELLKSSPYNDKLSAAGLFLRAIDAYGKQLPNLIQPHIGDQIAGGAQVGRLGELLQQASQLAPERLD